MGRRLCELEGCTKRASDGGTPYCKAHGGGKRCQEGCTKAAVAGGTAHCIPHGGGRRCQYASCLKSARGDTGYCASHGGANDASTRAAPNQLLQSARSTASRTAGVGGAKRRTAPSQANATRATLILEWNVTDYMFASIESCVNKSPRSM
jgi:hypothetical protein